MQDNINLNKIIGSKLIDILQSQWVTSYDGIRSCEVFVRLQNNILFELTYVDDEYEEFPIKSVSPDSLTKLIPAQLPPGSPNCFGDRVTEVVVSKCWPTFGLALSSGHFLYVLDWSPVQIGAFIEPINFKSIEDVYRYGGGKFKLQ